MFFQCDCGQIAPTERQRRVDDCMAHADGVHVYVQRNQLVTHLCEEPFCVIALPKNVTKCLAHSQRRRRAT